MIISHKHKFIFFHSRKAAGSSITVSLCRFLGIGDIQLGAIEDGINMKIYPPLRMVLESLPELSPNIYRKIFLRKISRKEIWENISSSIKAKYARRLGSKPQHASANAVKTSFPHEFNQYFKFCVVRNPWDKTVSDYFWRTRRLSNPPSFDEYVKAIENGDSLNGVVPPFHSNWEIYSIDGEVAMDSIIRFESLSYDLTKTLNNIPSLDWDGWLPNSKNRKRLGKEIPKLNTSYRDYYSSHTRTIIEQLYREEIIQFSYQF